MRGDEPTALFGFETRGFLAFLGEGFDDCEDCSGEGSEGERSELMSITAVSGHSSPAGRRPRWGNCVDVR